MYKKNKYFYLKYIYIYLTLHSIKKSTLYDFIKDIALESDYWNTKNRRKIRKVRVRT